MKKIGKIILATLLFLFIIICIGIYYFTRYEMPSFYTSEAQYVAYFKDHGLASPNFYTYKVGERTMHYMHMGADTLPLVIFMHGSPGCAADFKRYFLDSALRQKAQLISVDRPGFGDSDEGKGEPALEKQAALLKPILEKHNAPKTILVGHSLGGPMVFRMAADYPALIDGVISLAGSLDPELEPNEWHRPFVDVPPLRWIMTNALIASNTEIMGHEAALERLKPAFEKITIPTIISLNFI